MQIRQRVQEQMGGSAVNLYLSLRKRQIERQRTESRAQHLFLANHLEEGPNTGDIKYRLEYLGDRDEQFQNNIKHFKGSHKHSPFFVIDAVR
jgi:hypothetical protein